MAEAIAVGGMFSALQKLIAERTVVLIMAMEGDQIRVNVIPKKLEKGDDDKKDDKTEDLEILTTPFTVIGDAAELDADLPGLLLEFVQERRKAADSITGFKARADAARKLVEDQTKKLDAEAAKKLAASKTKVADAAKKNGEKPAEPAAPGLFGGEEDDAEENK